MKFFVRFKKVLACTVIMSMFFAESVSALELEGYVDDKDELIVEPYEDITAEEGILTDLYTQENGIYQEDLIEIPVNTEDTGVLDIADVVSENEITGATETSDGPEVYAEMFPGLDDSYVFSAEETESKEEVRENVDKSDGLREGIDYVEGQILVSAENLNDAKEYADAFNGELESFEYNLAVIDLNADRSLPEASVMDAVIASSDDESMLPAAWPNYYRYLYDDEIVDMDTALSEGISVEGGFEVSEQAAGDIADPLLNPDRVMYQWHHSLIGSKQAWNAGYNGKNVKVCVIDTGINSTHEDIKIKEASGCESNSNSYEDMNGHGSNVAGVIAAIGDNNKGGKGIAYGSDLYVINVNYYDSQKGKYRLDDKGIITALGRATETYKVDVINMSLGSPAYSDRLNSAVKNAYDHGIAVICAAGNNDTGAISYPAGCDGAISVAAVDKNNSRAFFSNYGDIDFSAPGVSIFSANIGGSSAYVGMNGTSQASPCISGIAAVLLGSGRITGSGSAKVENLKKLMASGCTSSGLGKGTPDLGKILGLGSVDSAPAKPTIKSDKLPGTYAEESITVSFNKIAGTTIYYTTDGTNVSYKDGVVSKGAEEYLTDGIILTGSSKVVVKAIAVNDTNRMVSPAASFTYYLNPKASVVIPRAKNGVNAVIKGGKLQMEAEIKPEYTANKKVEWSLEGNPSGVTITSSGLLRVSKDSSAVSCKVVAKVLDGSGTTGSTNIGILSEGNTVKKISAAQKSLTLYSKSPAATIEIKAMRKDNTAANASEVLEAVSQDIQVATASIANNNLTISPVGTGKTGILLTSKDGSGVTLTIKVVVKQSATDFDIEGLTGNKLAKGKGFKPLITFYPEDTALKKLDWQLTAVPSGTSASACGVKVNASTGAVSTKAGAVTGRYEMTAKVRDGSGLTKKYEFDVIDGRILKIGVETGNARIFRLKNAFGSSTEATIPFTVTGVTSENSDSISVTSSNPDMAEIVAKTVNAGSGEGSFTVRATGKAAGTVNITVASADGTNIKKKIKVSVVNPPSAVRLSVPKNRAQSLAKGKSMKLIATLETAYGKVDSATRKFAFTSDHPELISVNEKTGEVRSLVTTSSTPVKITAKAADGSKVETTLNVSPCALIKSISYTGPKKGRMPAGTAVELLGVVNPQESGKISGRFEVKVSKKGLGISPISEDGYYGVVVVGNKKGTYNVSIKPTDGSSAGISWTVVVR